MRRLAVLAAVTFAAVLGSAGSASAEVEWLCLPGAEPNPCRESLETTVQTEDGDRIERPQIATDPPVDCFYVYPTVSEQPSRNAEKEKEDAVVAIARFQAARFSELCNVYAPLYRQQTLGGLTAASAAPSPEALALAYGDVEEAWRDFLANHSRDRPFVIIGHSQGTRMLRRLVRDEIDPDPALRARLISAILLGGNVVVRKGERAGGDFQNIPACDAPGQTGCVIAFSTFNEPPPSNSRYGREPAQDTSGFGFPSGPDYEVLCTNPASLGANARAPLTTLVRGEPFPGVIGVLLTEMYGGPQPTADTPFLQPIDRYTGRCERSNDANVLMLEPIGSARKLNAAPDPSWGLHIADGNIALGELVGAVALQIATYTTPRSFGPRVYVRVRCTARGRPYVAVRGPDRSLVRRLEVRRRGRLLARDRRSPFRHVMHRRLSGKRIRTVVLMRGGRRIAFTLPAPRCG